MLQLLAARSAQPRSSSEAIARYGQLSLEARVAAASPHQLVTLLYERLGQQLHEASLAAGQGDRLRRLRATERALALVDGLDTSLDDARGGEVSSSLHAVYAGLRESLLSGQSEDLARACDSLSTILAAWRAIGPARA